MEPADERQQSDHFVIELLWQHRIVPIKRKNLGAEHIVGSF